MTTGYKSTYPHVGKTLNNLRWLAENPGKWMRWGRSPYAAKDLCPPAFERLVVSAAQEYFEYLPEGVDTSGLWIKYRGIDGRMGEVTQGD